MTWRHGSVGICMALVCALCASGETAYAEERAFDEPCDRATQHSFRAQMVTVPKKKSASGVKLTVGVEKNKTPWQRFASAMIGTMPPNIVDVTASLGEVLVVVQGLESKDVVSAVEVNVTHKNGAIDLTLDSVDVSDAIRAAPPPPERPFRPVGAFNLGGNTTVALSAP